MCRWWPTPRRCGARSGSPDCARFFQPRRRFISFAIEAFSFSLPSFFFLLLLPFLAMYCSLSPPHICFVFCLSLPASLRARARAQPRRDAGVARAALGTTRLPAGRRDFPARAIIVIIGARAWSTRGGVGAGKNEVGPAPLEVRGITEAGRAAARVYQFK